MITDDTEAVSGRQSRHIGFWFVGVKVLRVGQRCVERASITQARQTSVFGQAFPMEQDQGPAVNPLREFHLARARKVSRYFAVNSRPFAIWRSTSGSYGVSR